MIAIVVAVGLLACADSGVSRRIAVAPGETLAVVRAGEGPPVVLLPGLLGSAFSYRKVSAQLTAAGWGTVVIEPLGFGESSRPPNADYSFPAQAERVNAILDSLGISRALVIAQSVGVSVAFRLALAHPARVAGIVALDAAPLDRPSAPSVSRALALAPILELFGTKRISRNKVRAGLLAHSADTIWVTDSVVSAYAKPITDDFTGVLRGLKSMTDANPGPPIGPQLARISVPVVLLIGSGNRMDGVQPQQVAALRSALPQLRVDSVARSGQHLQEERPDAVVAAALSVEAALSADLAARGEPPCVRTARDARDANARRADP